MHFSKFLLTAGLGQSLALSFRGATDYNALAARDADYEDALEALYARDAEADFDDDDFDLHARWADPEHDDAVRLLARALVARAGVAGKDKVFKGVMNTLSGAKDVFDKTGGLDRPKPQVGPGAATPKPAGFTKKPLDVQPKLPKLDIPKLPKMPSKPSIREQLSPGSFGASDRS